jgi:MoaA/NifB/PqqE/SkfB family radical SAM enzyme
MKKGLSVDQIREVELELTGTCNLDCPLCTRSYENGKHLNVKNIRPLQEWINQLDTFPNLQYVCVSGSVSEPTMYKEFLPLMRYLVSRNCEIEVYTNANTHNESWWTELGTILRPTDKIWFTVCGSTQELHEKYRVGSSLEEVLKHARAYRASGAKNDWLQLIKFEYNKDDLESKAMDKIKAEFNTVYYCQSAPYQERFNIIKGPTDIKMPKEIGKKYNVIRNASLKRYDDGVKCEMKCKSFELRFLSIDNFGNIHPCFLYRMYKGTPFDHTDYTEIHEFKNRFCYECESLTKSMLERNGMERMG